MNDSVIYDYMIDIETLSTLDNACVISIGAVKFDPNAYDDKIAVIADSFYCTIELDFDKAHIDPKTVKFWFQQPKEAQDAIFSAQHEPTPLRLALYELNEFLDAHTSHCGRVLEPMNSNSNVWANSPRFDIRILDTHYKILDAGSTPWTYRNQRDVRTIIHYLQKYYALPDNDDLHNALSDAVWQTRVIQMFNNIWRNTHAISN